MESFVKREINCLAETLNIVIEEVPDDLLQTSNEKVEEPLNQLQLTRKEIQSIENISHVTYLNITEQIVRPYEEMERLVDVSTEDANVNISVEVKLAVNNGIMRLYCVVPSEYPWQPVRFRIGDTFQFDTTTIDVVQKLIDTFHTSKSRKGYVPFYKAIEKITSKLTGNQQELFDSLTGADQGNTQSADDVKGDTAYIAYPRTCGFSWNCYN